jgi:hypothetical protein
LQDEIAMAEQMTGKHGSTAALLANETATALAVMGDAEGAARWRRIRDIILAAAIHQQDGFSESRA